jgi:YhcN/YlaJ family sporulation lipoprotein
MKQFKISAFMAVVLLSAWSSLAAGCGNQQAAPPDNRLKAQNVGEAGMKAIGNPTKVSDHLEALARGIPGVQGANCVVFGKYAVVGIDVDPKMDRSEVGTLKYAVAEAFRKDPYGVNAVVTADIDMAQRIHEIRADVMKGRPIAGFAEELSDIVGRLMPQIPRNIIPPKTPEDTGIRTHRTMHPTPNAPKEDKKPSE